MSAPEGNSFFCFPESLNLKTLRFEGKQNELFPERTDIKRFVIQGESKKTDTFVIHLNIKCIRFF